MTNLETALLYLDRGWSVIPCYSNKMAMVSWKPFQKKLPTKDQIIKWWTASPNANIAIITGKLSNLTVVDVDPRNGGSNQGMNFITPTVKTGGGGWHYYFKFDGSKKRIGGVGIDIQSEGSYVIAPPSKTTGVYEWLIEGDPITLPEGFKETKTKYKGVSQGERNNMAASVCGSLLKQFDENQWESKVWPMLLAWNSTNTPPLPIKELSSVYSSISKREISSVTNTLSSTASHKSHINNVINGEMEAVNDIVNDRVEATFKGIEMASTASINGTHKRQWFERKKAIKELSSLRARVNPQRMADLLEKIFKGYGVQKDGHWLWIAQRWNPRAMKWVLNSMMKQQQNGKVLTNPPGLFTFSITKRKRRKSRRWTEVTKEMEVKKVKPREDVIEFLGL